jgi:YHS domain-containing protein
MPGATYTNEARILKALGHPKRLEILQLVHQRQLTAGEIERMTGWPQANLSQHLHALKLAKVIIAVRQGKHIRYRLAHPSFTQIIATVTATSAPRKATAREIHRTEVQDLVCGMWVEPAAASWQAIYKGATYFFCASGCYRQFTKSPERYV